MFKGEYLIAYGTTNYERAITEASRKDKLKRWSIRRRIKGGRILNANPQPRAEVYIVRSIHRQEFHLLGSVEG